VGKTQDTLVQQNLCALGDCQATQGERNSISGEVAKNNQTKTESNPLHKCLDCGFAQEQLRIIQIYEVPLLQYILLTDEL
jgi:hypothetical protein